MNERIREMAYKTCFESGFDGPEHFVFYHTDLQKFAELIVKECAKSVWQDAPFGANKLIENIQQRLGVNFDAETLRD